MKLSNENDSLFVQEFLKKYMSLGFTNLPKKEIDILVFTLLNNYGYLEGKNYYSKAKELMIEEKKFKRFILDSSIRNEKSDTIVNSISEIQKSIFTDNTIVPIIDNQTEIIKFGIQDPVIKQDFIQVLREVGYTYDQNQNDENISMPIYAFMAVFCRYDDDLYTNFKKLVEEQIKDNKEKLKAFNSSAPYATRIQKGLGYINASLNTLAAIATILGITVTQFM